MTQRLLLNVNEVASLLGCGRTYVYGMIQRGELPAVKLGRLTKVPRCAVEQYVACALDADLAGRSTTAIGWGRHG